MSDKKIDWFLYALNWKKRKLIEKLTGRVTEYKRIEHKEIVGPEEGNRIIYNAIITGKPFAFTRYGMWEIDCAVDYEKDRIFGSHNLADKLKASLLFENLGEFGKWAELVREDSKEIDYSAVWYRVKMEDWFLKTYASQANYLHYSALEPYYFEHPWSIALKGKRVLVVNPFTDLIENQYKKRTELFPGKDVLPEFTLMTMKSVWFIDKKANSEFNDWFEALEYMRKRLKKYEFDIAILGCGPFGFHLAAEIKRMGKQAIVLGGATQILFGIRGQRWDEIPQVRRYYNDSWIRPSQSDKPEGAQKLDAGCYW